MGVVRYITHPNVVVDPDVPVPQWHLSALGRQRFDVMLTRPWVSAIRRVIASSETKSVEAATVLAIHLGLEVEVRPATREIDRSATGYLPAAEHERVADAAFAQPNVSSAGWETAVAAQARIVEALDDVVVAAATGPDAAVVGHGAVGTLWWCHLAGERIARRWDQPGQGHLITVDAAARRPLHHWVPIDS
jgi:broad specificity phosphatase PhoE